LYGFLQCSKNLTVIPGSTRNRKVEVGKPRFAALKRVQGDGLILLGWYAQLQENNREKH